LPRLALPLVLLSSAAPAAAAQTFEEDVAFVRKHTQVVVLSDSKSGARLAVCPELQGRVLTSSARGDEGQSFGWINRELLASGKKDPRFNGYGGEDRFWLGPEGGQFALFFKKGAPFTLEHWRTPPPIDTEKYRVTGQVAHGVWMNKKMELTNHAGTRFEIELDRSVRLLQAAQVLKDLGVASAPDADIVAFESDNRITNVGSKEWKKETGLVSIWILGMFKPSPNTTVVVPFKPGPEPQLGPAVNDAYFGKVPPDRLVVRERVLFFRGDGALRSKIGVSAARAARVLGSYDPGEGVLTLVQFDKPENAREYVNSMWEMQKEPYGGDVVNSYNDGPAAPGAKPLGPFYELETSSPAAALAPDGFLTHRHRTIHAVGAKATLDAIARKALGVSLDEIESALPKTAGAP
jgi:hypothetical protein